MRMGVCVCVCACAFERKPKERVTLRERVRLCDSNYSVIVHADAYVCVCALFHACVCVCQYPHLSLCVCVSPPLSPLGSHCREIQFQLSLTNQSA